MISGESMNWHEDAGEAISLKILAFDQASQKTGVAWFEDSTLLGYEVLDYSRVKDADLRVRLMMESMFNPPPGYYTGSTKGGVSQHHNYLLLPKGSSLLPSIFLLIVFFLFLYVFSYRFFIHISYCRYVISSRPKMSISPLAPIFRMSVKQHQCAFSLQI